MKRQTRSAIHPNGNEQTRSATKICVGTVGGLFQHMFLHVVTLTGLHRVIGDNYLKQHSVSTFHVNIDDSCQVQLLK